MYFIQSKKKLYYTTQKQDGMVIQNGTKYTVNNKKNYGIYCCEY